MMNLKKTLAVVLAFVMVLSMGAISTFAYTDVEAGTITDEAVSILSGLKIIEGFEDGTFRPEETVTRAQMAAIICRTLGYENQAESSKGITAFNDVAGDHWAAGYVNVAQAQGIINGYGNGNFGPEDKVTYEQAVKMIVSALGYDIAAQDKGGYPTGYLAIASAEGITKKANGRVGDAASRGTIAVLVYNSLEVRLMDQYAWTSDGTSHFEKSNANILTHYLDIVKVEGTVVANPITAVAANGEYVAGSEPFVKIAGSAWVFGSEANREGYRPYEKKAIGATDALDNKDGKFDAERVDVNSLAGKYVIAYIGHDEVTDRETVFAIAESKEKNNNLKISANKLVESGHKWFIEPGFVGYKDGGAKRISLDEGGATLYVNYDVVGSVSTTAGIAANLGNGGVVEFVSNDGDDEIEFIFATAYSDESVVKKVDDVNGTYIFETYDNGALAKINPNDENSIAVIYKDGQLATAADLAENDTVSTVKVAKNFYIYYASSATVTGAVDSYVPDDGIVTVAGTDYEVSNQYYDAKTKTYEIAKLAGEEGLFFLNVDGQISWNETAPIGGGSYALIANLYYKQEKGENVPYVTAVLADGTVENYEVSSKAELQDYEGENGKDLVTELQTALSKESADLYVMKAAQIKDASKILVKLSVNSSGKVTKARTLEGKADSTVATKEYDAAAFSIGGISFDENAVVFSATIDSKKGYVLADDVKVGGLSTFFVDGEAAASTVYVHDGGKQDIYNVAIGEGLVKNIATDGSVFVVSSKKTISYNEDDAYMVTGMIDGEEVTITIYNENKPAVMSAAKGLGAGDVMLIAEPDAEGIVSDIEVLVNYTYGKAGSANDTANLKDKDEVASGIGALTDVDSYGFYINAAIVDDYDGKTEWAAANDRITYKNANYILVDFTEDTKEPAITAEAASKALFDEAYDTEVYVRVVDEKLADVVVYRLGEKVSAAPTISVANGVITVAAAGVDEIYVKIGNGSTVAYTAAIDASAYLKEGDVIKAYTTTTGMAQSKTVSYVVEAADLPAPTPAP